MMTWVEVDAQMEWSPALDVSIQYASTALIPDSIWRGIAQAARGEGKEIDVETL